MACKNSSRLKKLINLCLEDGLFKSDLSSSNFKCFIEILKNVHRHPHCFSKKTLEKIKKFKKIVKKITSSRLSLKKRKKIFLKSPKKWQSLCYNGIIKSFLKKCVETD